MFSRKIIAYLKLSDVFVLLGEGPIPSMPLIWGPYRVIDEAKRFDNANEAVAFLVKHMPEASKADGYCITTEVALKSYVTHYLAAQRNAGDE